MNRCGHQDCFTCPWPDCKESGTNGIQSIPRPKEIDGKRHKTQPKQSQATIHTHQGFKRMG